MLCKDDAESTDKNIVVFNTGVNSIDWKTLVSPDVQYWVEIKAADSLATGNSSYYTATEPWGFINIQVKSTTAGQAARDRIYLHASRE